MVMKGTTMSAESRAKMSAAAKARPSNRIGKKHTVETRAKISAVVRVRALRGAAAPGYIDGKGVERRGERLSEQAKQWRYDVMARDEFMCIHCGDDQGGNLVAHHRKPWSTHPELRFDLNNGVTLCEACHHLHHYIYPFIPGLG